MPCPVLGHPTRGGSPVPVCDACFVRWSRDGKFLYVWVGMGGGKTFQIRLAPGKLLPNFPAAGLRSEADLGRYQNCARKTGPLQLLDKRNYDFSLARPPA